MSLPPESIEEGKCYLAENGRVRRVMRILPDGRIRYKYRGQYAGRWRSGALPRLVFAATVARGVPCDWKSEADEWEAACQSRPRASGLASAIWSTANMAGGFSVWSPSCRMDGCSMSGVGLSG